MADAYKAFLKEFCGRDEAKVNNEKERLLSDLAQQEVTYEEVEGECSDLCWQYLTSSGDCPTLLAAYITHEVNERLMKSELVLKAKISKAEEKTDNDVKESTFEGIKMCELAQQVLQYVKDTCDNWNVQLPTHLETDDNRNTQLLVVSDHAIKNTRRKMEDRHVILPHLCQLTGLKWKNDLKFYAVYDGHGGVEAARYAATHLHWYLVRCFTENTSNTLEESLHNAFKTTDERFVQHAKQNSILSGSTAVCAAVDSDKFYIAWLGDSQAWLVQNGKPVQLMQPHKPERADEKKRIEDMGGYVVWFGAWRVNGNLSVSRAIGDANFKPFVSGIPDVACFDRNQSDDYLVLACDGLWDTLMPQQLIAEVQKAISEGVEKKDIAKRLTQIAKDNGSNDNISVIVIFFRDDITMSTKDADDKENQDKTAGKPKDGTGTGDAEDHGGEGGNKDSTTGEREGDVDRGKGNTGNIESIHLTLGMKCRGTSAVILDSAQPDVMKPLSANEGSSGSDLPGLSEDSRKNVLDPLKLYSSDDTNGQNTSGETYFGIIGYESSPPSNQEKSHGSEASSDDLHIADAHSDASAGDIVLPNSRPTQRSASRRLRRRRHSGNRRSRKENRRPSGEKSKNNTPPCLHSIIADRKLEASFRESCRSLSQTSSHLRKTLTGFAVRSPPQKPSAGLRSATNRGRWTIAVEEEGWAAIFESNKPIVQTQAMNLSTHW